MKDHDKAVNVVQDIVGELKLTRFFGDGLSDLERPYDVKAKYDVKIDIEQIGDVTLIKTDVPLHLRTGTGGGEEQFFNFAVGKDGKVCKVLSGDIKGESSDLRPDDGLKRALSQMGRGAYETVNAGRHPVSGAFLDFAWQQDVAFLTSHFIKESEAKERLNSGTQSSWDKPFNNDIGKQQGVIAKSEYAYSNKFYRKPDTLSSGQAIRSKFSPN